MIEYQTGNLLEADAEALVNTVNCVGVMGKGIALQFKQAFPANFDQYAKACKAQQVKPGKMQVFETGAMVNPRWIINFPTKTHWKAKSRLEHVEQGLVALVQEINQRNIHSIALPPLGCGNGGLPWDQVQPLIQQYLGDVSVGGEPVKVLLFAPQSAPAVDAMPVNTTKPEMTRARALFIRLIELYSRPGYRLSLLEVQKLSYFLQVAGEALRLKFTKHLYGPYAENLNFVLQRIEGHFIRGYGDRSKDAQIHLLPGAVEAANAYLEADEDASQRLQQVRELIEGFETPYGMELLSSVHWVVNEIHNKELDQVLGGVHGWNKRKERLMKPRHVQKALQQLEAQHWV